ncbi:MAG: T9SS type A sorting domain-containing protein [Chitinophagaceae bacterium]|nr:T9SS type A sorting domain-containing protein [Chitinophagaceae bacterium]
MVQDVIHIAEWDSFTELQVPVLFFIHQLAADGKIYISAFNGVSYFNVINSPDSLGLECDFSPHSFVLPQYHTDIPSFPNYDLGAAPGGDTCNAVYTTPPQLSLKTSLFSIAPNPVSDWLNIIYQSNEDALFELFDFYGKKVGAISLFHYFKNRLLNVSELPPGVYLAAVSCKEKRFGVRR